MSSKAAILENFLKLPIEQQNKITHIREWTQKLPKGFSSVLKITLEKNCFICKSNRELQPHHITYTPIEEAITVCNTCHSYIHEKKINYKRTIEQIESSRQIREHILHPTIEDKRERFKFTNRCGMGKCRTCSLNCKMRQDYIDVIKADMIKKRGGVLIELQTRSKNQR